MQMKETEEAMTHVNTFNRVLTELVSQNLNFDEEVKALALLSSLPASWDVFCTTITNGSAKLTLDDTLGQELSEELRRKSLGLSVEDTAEAHYSEETSTSGRVRNRTHCGQTISRSRGKSPNAFCTYCKMSGHQTRDCWSLAWKNKGKRPDRNAGSSGSEQQRPEINLVTKSHGEVLSLEESTTGEIMYSAEEAHTWLLDSGATFHATPHREWFMDYSRSAASVRLRIAQECKIAGVGTIPL